LKRRRTSFSAINQPFSASGPVPHPIFLFRFRNKTINRLFAERCVVTLREENSIQEDSMAAGAAVAPAVAAQPTSWAPTAKVAVGSLAGALTLISVQISSHYGFKLSAEAGGAITTIVTFVIQYLTPERK
jgi:hypothetical protein